MSYQEFRPHPTLQSHIDAYWVVKSADKTAVRQRIFPDGCIDIILNLGNLFSTDNGTFTMRNDSAYLVGTMTRYKDIVREPDTFLIGIRFKPLGFPAFFRFSSLHEIAEKTIGFNKNLLPEIHHWDRETISLLDHFFYNRLSEPHYFLSQVLQSIEKDSGLISVDVLAKRHFTTTRNLERNFKQYLGITPKAYANFVRYQNAVNQIKKKSSKSNLLDIAFNAGYYDHAHLTNEVKKYSGLLPSQL